MHYKYMVNAHTVDSSVSLCLPGNLLGTIVIKTTKAYGILLFFGGVKHQASKGRNWTGFDIKLSCSYSRGSQ